MAAPQVLVHNGPIIAVDIGFDPTIISQALGVPVPIVPPSAPPQPPAGGPSGAPPPTPSSPGLPAPAGGVSPAVGGTVPSSSLLRNVPALIDTGARESCIDETLAQQLQLPLVNQVQTAGVHGPGVLNQYLAYISIPLLGTVQAGLFTGAMLVAGGQPYQALIGRTLLSDTLLVYDGRSGSVKIAR